MHSQYEVGFLNFHSALLNPGKASGSLLVGLFEVVDGGSEDEFRNSRYQVRGRTAAPYRRLMAEKAVSAIQHSRRDRCPTGRFGRNRRPRTAGV